MQAFGFSITERLLSGFVWGNAATNRLQSKVGDLGHHGEFGGTLPGAFPDVLGLYSLPPLIPPPPAASGERAKGL